MASYSIKDLEKITGIKAHTIRIWERRFNIVIPQRTATNIRYYSEEDLKKILNISILNQHGFKISKIASLKKEEIKQRILDLCLNTKNTDIQIETMVIAMLELNETKFFNVLTNAIIKSGFESTVEQILFPFLLRIGILWQAGSITCAQEHFVSYLIRQKLIVAIDNERPIGTQSHTPIIFFLPEGEHHELALLFYSLLARKEGFPVIYLGASVSLQDLKMIGEIKPDALFFGALTTAIDKKEIGRLFTSYSTNFPKNTFFFTGKQIKSYSIDLPPQFHKIDARDTFRELLKEF